MSEINLKITIHAPQETIWKAWTHPDEIPKWFSPEAHIEPRKNGAYELYFNPENHESMSTKDCKITQYTPHKTLQFQWKGPDQFKEIMNNPPQTIVTVNLTHRDHHTTIHLTHTGWKNTKKWRRAKNWHKNAWQEVLQQLKIYTTQDLDTH